jgi:formylglycine-generating enzyme required for sulfatase activity
VSGGVPSERFGPWIAEAEVGRGGTARVFRARHDEDASLRAALKLTKPGVGSTEILEGWELERRMLARLDVPGVARLLGAGTSETEGPWIATEWVEGQPLDAALAEAGAGFDARLRLLEQLCRTLHAVHRQGVVHGDVRPENVLATGVEEGLRCTVVDFGLAGSGTEVDVRRDVGGLGEIVEAALPAELRPRAHRAELDAVVAHATAADLGERYPSAHALAEDLRRIRSGEAVSVRRHDRAYRLVRAVRSHRRGLATAAGVAVVALGVVVVGLAAARSARVARAEAEQRRADLLLLSDVATLERLEAELPDLPPAEPAARAAYRAWADAARAVLARAVTIGARTAPADAASTDAASTAEPEAAATERWRAEQAALLEAGVARFRVDDPLVSPLAWVEGRLERIALADSLARTEPVRRAWRELRSDVAADPRFDGWTPTPDPALVPLGANPNTGLWHLWHVPSGDRPERAADGGWGSGPASTEDDGLVFVLLPGGAFTVGAQGEDPDGPRWDPDADADESPLSRVELAPLYVAAHEMTRGQWIRSLGVDPLGGGDTRPFNRPVTGVSWDGASAALARLGLALPTEPQWEYAARGGTDTPWFTGADPASLSDRVSYRLNEEAFLEIVSAPGSYTANPFGLHDTAGNVWEWTSGIYGWYDEGTTAQPSAGFEPGTGELIALDLGRRTIRGGGSNNVPVLLRASNRSAGTRDERPAAVGVRPVRPAVLSR